MVSRSPSKLGIFAKKEESVEFITRYRTVRVKLFDILLVNWLHSTPAIIELWSNDNRFNRSDIEINRGGKEFACLISKRREINICDCACSDVSISSSVREWLRSPAFDARQWEDEELLLMLQTMFVELDLPQKFNIPLPILRNFLYEVYNNYNEVPFHNFRHCFCVAQMASIYIFIYIFLSNVKTSRDARREYELFICLTNIKIATIQIRCKIVSIVSFSRC